MLREMNSKLVKDVAWNVSLNNLKKSKKKYIHKDRKQQGLNKF